MATTSKTPFFTRTFKSESETRAFATALALQCRCGDLIRLEGELGTGKSVIARALIQALGNNEPIPSPTYTLLQTYQNGRLPAAHLDCYRLADPEEVLALDLEPYRKHGVVIAEWPENAGDALPEDLPDLLNYFHCTMDNAGVLTMRLRVVDEQAREVEFFCNPAWQTRLGDIFPELQRPSSDIVRQKFIAKHGWRGHVMTCASGKEAWSTRSYWRFSDDDGSYILMDAPPPLQEVANDIAIGNYLRENGIRIPKVDMAKSDPTQGLLILEDFGDRILQKEPTDTADFEGWVEMAVDLLAKLVQLPQPQWRTYSALDMWLETARLTDYYLPHITGHATAPELRQELYDIWQPLYEKMRAVPFGFMHSDYHAGNLMCLADKPTGDLNDIGLIDFQDASCGPITYDIISFLRNDRVPFSPELEAKLKRRFLDAYDGVDEAAFDISAELIILQRMLKIIGGATKLAVRKNRLDILALLPRCWQVVDGVLARPECADLKRWFERHVPREK